MIKSMKRLPPKPGDVFYSEYFKKRGIVVDYFDQDNWYFRLEGTTRNLKANCRPQELEWICYQ